MKKSLIILSLGLSVVLGVIFLIPSYNIAKAGFEPSPFQPEINQLGAVANILHSADYRVATSIAHPPDPCVPTESCNAPALVGAVNRLEAINVQVSSADDMVDSIITEVMGVEPEPFRIDVIPALEIVRDAAGLIDARISAFVDAQPPDPIIPIEYFDALEGVARKASDVVETAEWGIDELEIPCPCFADGQWRRIWVEWPADSVSRQCAENPSAYSFELGHWVFGDSQAREFIAVVDTPINPACRVQYGNPTATYDVPITSAQVQICVDMMRAKAADEGEVCL